MHQNVGIPGEHLHLVRCGMRTRWRRLVVRGVATDHHAARGSIDAIGGMAGNVRRLDRTDPDIPGRPDQLWFVSRIEIDHIQQLCGSSRRSALALGVALRDFAGLQEHRSDILREFPATENVTERRFRVGRANHIKLRPRGFVMPTQLHHVCEAIRMIGMNMREKDRIDVSNRDRDLRKPDAGGTAGVELQCHRTTIAGVVAVTDKRANSGEAVDRCWPPFGSGQCDSHAGSGGGKLRRRGKSRPNSKHRRYCSHHSGQSRDHVPPTTFSYTSMHRSRLTELHRDGWSDSTVEREQKSRQLRSGPGQTCGDG